jgi:hypothetical protein
MKNVRRQVPVNTLSAPQARLGPYEDSSPP